MRTLTLLAATAALAGVAAPAAAQYYPTPQPYPQSGYGYPQQGYGYPQQGYAYPQQGGIAGIIGQLLGNRRYATNDRQAIAQCAAAAQSEVARRTQSAYGQQGYNQPPYGNAYGYNQAYAGQARVTAITNVQRMSRSNLRVTGLLDSGMNPYAQQQYGYNQQAYARGDIRFRCTVDGYGRVTNLRLNRVR